MQTVVSVWERFREVLATPVFTLGGAELTIGTFVQLIVLIPLLVILTGLLKRWTVRMLARTSRSDAGVRDAVGKIVRYVTLAIGLLIILQTSGIDITTLNVLAGAVGLGVGIGLQSVAGNFVSGLIILFERPIKLGDRVVVGDVEGNVVAINARSTTVVTNDNIAIIVPNSHFVTETVVNWSHGDAKVRFRIPVAVAYGTDLPLAERLMLEAATANPDVLPAPESAVRLLAFGDNGLELELRAWTVSLVQQKGALISTLNRAIHDAFVEHGISFPFPQRDVHVRGGALRVAVEPGAGGRA
jgi:small-conductance mechanosensitive channel